MLGLTRSLRAPAPVKPISGRDSALTAPKLQFVTLESDPNSELDCLRGKLRKLRLTVIAPAPIPQFRLPLDSSRTLTGANCVWLN